MACKTGSVQKAAEWATNCHAAYLASDKHGLRLRNQAFFKHVWVTEDGVVGWEYNEPFNLVMARHGHVPPLPAALRRVEPDEMPERRTASALRSTREKALVG